MPVQIRRPHQAVREIVDHKARIDVPMEQRQRALLIQHALAQESIRRGWKVIAYPSTFETDPWNGRKKRVSPGPDLFSIDAGDSAAVIRLRMQQKRVDHVPTEKELADEARYKWRSYPKHDYVPTERMRLEIRSGSHDALTLDDTVATRIEDKLLRAIEKIEQMSVDARQAAERHRQWEIQRAEDQRHAEELRKRATRYSNWAETLEQLRTDLVRHRELAEVVAGLREAVDRRGPEHEYAEALTDYLSWSEAHLEESDPLRRIWLPQGERPDLSYDEWQEWTAEPSAQLVTRAADCAGCQHLEAERAARALRPRAATLELALWNTRRVRNQPGREAYAGSPVGDTRASEPCGRMIATWCRARVMPTRSRRRDAARCASVSVSRKKLP